MTNNLSFLIAPGKVEAFTTMVGQEPPYHVITPHEAHSFKVVVERNPNVTGDEFDDFGALFINIKGCTIGQGVCRNCFQVGEEVVNGFKSNGIDSAHIFLIEGPKLDVGSMGGGHYLDLPEENRLLLIKSGVKSENIHISTKCTYVYRRFYSARYDGRSTAGKSM